MSSGYALCAILRTAGWETPVSPLAVSLHLFLPLYVGLPVCK